jgi:hypothetical protein
MRKYKTVILPFLCIRLKFVSQISGIVTREEEAEENIVTEQRRSE